MNKQKLEELADKLMRADEPDQSLDADLYLLAPFGPNDRQDVTASLDAALSFAQRLGFAPDNIMHDALAAMGQKGWHGGKAVIPQMAIYVCREVVEAQIAMA